LRRDRRRRQTTRAGRRRSGPRSPVARRVERQNAVHSVRKGPEPARILAFRVVCEDVSGQNTFVQQTIYHYDFTPMTISLILLSLSILGVLDAAYLSYIHLFGGGACVAGSGCGAVMASPYSRLLGVPLATYGLGLYLAIMIGSWRSLRPADREDSLGWVSVLALAGNLPTLFLLYLQAFVIGAWCLFCLASTVVAALLLAISVRERSRCAHLRPFAGRLFRTREVIPVALTLVIPPLAFLPLQAGVSRSAAGVVPSTTEVVARIGEREISIDEIDRAIHLRLYKERTEFRMEWLERELLQAEADARGLSLGDLIKQDVYSKIEITEEDVDRRWEQIKSRFPPGVTKESVIGNIRNELGKLRSEPALKVYTRSLKGRYRTEFTPPASERMAIDPNPRGGPEKGSSDAPVTIVEFSDLECSYCSRAHARLNRLVKSRVDDIRLVYRHYPLDMHENARHAAELAVCAQRQGKFWDFADILFTNQKNLGEEAMDLHAERAGLDIEELNACVASGEGSRVVEADMAEGDALGVTSTPSFFVNGHYVGSLPDGDGLEVLIDQEMKRGRR